MSASDYGDSMKPCPLCGGKAGLRNVNKGINGDVIFREFMIVCNSCGLSSRVARVTAEITTCGTLRANFDELRSIENLWNGRKDNE